MGLQMKRILISGSRDWDDQAFIENAIYAAIGLLHPREDNIWDSTIEFDSIVLVHGDCPTGADATADAVAEDIGLSVERHPADWNRYGKRAGYLRNQEMVDAGADIVLVFNKNSSRGASMTARLAREAGLPVIEYKVEE